jgi:hypothetical protein
LLNESKANDYGVACPRSPAGGSGEHGIDRPPGFGCSGRQVLGFMLVTAKAVATTAQQLLT